MIDSTQSSSSSSAAATTFPSTSSSSRTSTEIPNLRKSRTAWFFLLLVGIWSSFMLLQERDTILRLSLPLSQSSEEIQATIKSIHPIDRIPTTSTTTTSNNNNETIHVLLGIKGNHSGFLAEFQVALKNLLLQAPIQQSMHIHIMTDQDAYQAIVHDPSAFQKDDHDDPLHVVVTSLHQQWWSIQPIQIHIYNVEQQLQQRWKPFLQQKFQMYSFEHMTNRHTVGAFFRLLAHEVVLQHDPTIEYMIYIDPDVLFLANIQAVWKERPLSSSSMTHPELENKNSTILFAWGASMCSGFLLLHIPRLVQFWELVDTLDLTTVAQQYSQSPNDQLFLRAMNVTYPDKVALLSPQWDINIADGIWRYGRTIVQYRPTIGMMHFNGGPASDEPYYKVHDFLTKPDLKETWGIALYYTRMPWTWARYLASSQIPVGQPSYPLELFTYPDG